MPESVILSYPAGSKAKILLRFTLLLAMLAVCGLQTPVLAARYDGKLTVRVVDQETNLPIAARMELKNSRGRPVRIRPAGAVPQDDYFVFAGEVTLQLRKGSYEFLIEAGPEYQTRPGHFKIDKHAEDSTTVTLQRRVNMQETGWWAGDLDVNVRADLLPELMRATRVNLVPLLVRENTRGKCKTFRLPKNFSPPQTGDALVGPECARDHRRGGGLLIFGSSEDSALQICQLDRDAADLSARTGSTVVALTPYAWDLPVWVASGRIDAVQIIHRNALVNDATDNEGWGRGRDKAFFPGKTGNGRWSEHIYHHLLNCGIRIPPAAGSGAGSNKNPVGTNRVYVQCGERFSTESWFDGLKAGKVVVTNGPLLRTRVAGEFPGHQFHLEKDETRDFQIGLDLAFYEQAPVEYLEIIKNGKLEHEVRLDELAKQHGRLPPITFDDSGWFLVRAMTSKTNNYQYATTGPYYVTANYRPRVSRGSVQFFLDWLAKARQEFADQADVLKAIDDASPFWQKLLADANAE